MSELPKGWVAARAEDICEKVQSGSTPRNNPFTETGDIPYLKVYNIVNQKIAFNYKRQFISNDIHEEKLGRSKVFPNDILMNIVGPPLGKIAIVSSEYPEWNINQALTLFRTNEEILLSKFLFYFLNEGSSIKSIHGDLKGTVGQVNISLSQCRNFAIPCPSLPEQKRIVEKLDEVLAQVDTIKARLDGIPELLKRFRQSVLASAVSGKLTEEWRGKTSSMKKIAISQDHLEIPVQWDIYDLESLINTSRKICYGVVQPGEEVDGGKKLIRVCDINNGSVNTENLRTISSEIDEQYSRSKVQKFDLLVTIVGAIGRVAMIERDIDANIARVVARVSPNTDLIEPRYLHIWLSCPKLQWWLNNSSREVARKTLNLSELKQANVALPCLKEQKEIVRLVDQYFASADTIEAQVKKAQARVGNLTQSILAKAFRGELVPQNDDDEPAEMLLDRIAKARKEAEALAKVAKKAGKKTA